MKKGFTLLEVIIVVLLVMVVIGIMCCGVHLADPEATAKNAAETNGYTDITVQDCSYFFASWRGCSNSDTITCTVKAKNVNKRDVTFKVCSGLILKGATIRTVN